MNPSDLSLRVFPVFLIALLVALTACDTSEPEAQDVSSDLVGTWTLQSSEPFAVVTVSESDRVPGLESVTGGIFVDQVDLPFKYMDVLGYGTSDGEGNELYRSYEVQLFTHPNGFAGGPDGVPTCVLVFNDYVQLSASYNATPEPHVGLMCGDFISPDFGVAGAGLFTFDPDQLTLSLSGDLLLSYYGPESASDQERRVQGSVDIPVTQVSAGTPTRIVGQTGLDELYSLDVFPADTRADFFRNGTYSSTYTLPQNIGIGQGGFVEERGTWSTSDGVLTMVAETVNGEQIAPSQTAPVSFDYAVEEGVLNVELATDPCGADLSCLQTRGSALRLNLPESLESLTQGVAVQFARSTQ